MTNISKDGGPAFPTVVPENFHAAQDGMSLRDWFAGQALTGICTDLKTNGSFAAFAREAYALADSMLAERSKP